MRHKYPLKKRVLIVGCGDVGLRTARRLLPHYRVFGLVRSTDAAAQLRTEGVTPVLADLDDMRSLTRIAGIADVVLHFAPTSTAGSTDLRTGNLLAALAQRSLPQRLIYISTSGVYGDCAGAWIDETRSASPATERAVRRLDAERQLRDFARHTAVKVSILRVPGIYAASRLPLERIRAAMPILCAADDVYSNHIHADDLARIAELAIYRGRNARIYHASDEGEMKMGAYFQFIAQAFDLPAPPQIPLAQAVQSMSAVRLSFMNESRRLSNARLKRELRLRLMYPTVAEGYGV
ncbi:NAD(P)-dependent oxidoreductase [Sulfuriferula sp. AH1]|uniref:SDR family oxidoreductase n=1 Tax=Sulfuriferula sp. AH1 TaxID=1985873 RepID=UPI000B3B2575|nr:SDR family oxidoreductase [Sulfuriferula sp. AH1]ARU30516.1 NAD(P)-dependent oxidoreductase [Sulfuriferula sp. AH1]